MALFLHDFTIREKKLSAILTKNLRTYVKKACVLEILIFIGTGTDNYKEKLAAKNAFGSRLFHAFSNVFIYTPLLRTGPSLISNVCSLKMECSISRFHNVLNFICGIALLNKVVCGAGNMPDPQFAKLDVNCVCANHARIMLLRPAGASPLLLCFVHWVTKTERCYFIHDSFFAALA